jgi:hypothetical protein
MLQMLHPARPDRIVRPLHAWTDGGRLYVALELLGPSLSALAKPYRGQGLPLPIVARITTQVLI